MRRLPRPSRPSAPSGRCSKARLPWTGRPPRRPSSSARSRRRARGRGSASATRKQPCCETFASASPAPAEGYPFPPIGRAVFGNSRKFAEDRAIMELERSMGQSPLSVNIMGWTIHGDMDCLCRRPVRLRRNPDTFLNHPGSRADQRSLATQPRLPAAPRYLILNEYYQKTEGPVVTHFPYFHYFLNGGRFF